MPQHPVIKTKSQRPGRTSKTQAKLFNAAIEIMSVKGPDSATVEEVALRAGVSKGTVYYNFGSKKTMIDQLLQYGTDLLVQEMEAAAQEERDPRAALEVSIYTALKYLEDKPGYTRLWISEVWKSMNNWSETLIDNRKGLLDYLEVKITAIGDHYNVDPGQDARATSIVIFGAAYMLSMDRQMHNVRRSVEDGTRAIMQIVDGYIRGK